MKELDVKYVNIFLFPVINLLINILKIFVIWLTVKYRVKVREVVYSYMYRNNNYSLLGLRDFKDGYLVGKYNNKFKLVNCNKLTFILYFYLVWIWYDDFNHDVINNKLLVNNEEYISNICSMVPNNSFKEPNKTLNIVPIIPLMFLSLFYSSNNFNNYFRYNRHDSYINITKNLTLGWKEEFKVPNSTIRYKKYSLHLDK